MADLLINNFQKKVNKTYLQEFSKMKNVDCDTVSGVAMVNYKLESDNASYSSYTFTATADSDRLTTSAIHGYSGLVAVTVSTTGTLPAGLSAGTVYYVIPELSNTLKLADSISNCISATPIDITDEGTGTHTITPVTMGAVQKIVDSKGSSSYFNLFAIDDNGVIWVKYIDGTWTVISGNTNTNAREIVIWKDYLFVMGTTKISVYGKLSLISSGSASWTNDWATFSQTISSDRPAIVGQDDMVYIGDGKVVASIMENTSQTFNPASGATYTFNNAAVDLPDNYQITCLEELGNYLAIGTKYGYNYGAGNVADIFPWDRVSTTFEMPVRLKTCGVRSLININNVLYAIAGLKGDIYATDLTSSRWLARISAQQVDLQQEQLQIYTFRNAVAQFNNKLLFGATTSMSGSPVGIFSYNIETGGISMDYTISSSNDAKNIFSLYVSSDNVFYAGWEDETTNGIDKLSQTHRYSTSEIITGLYKTGTNRRRRVFKHWEIALAKSLETGNSVALYYRQKLNENFTLIGTMSEGLSQIFDRSIETESIQVKIVMTTSTLTNYTPELISVKLI